VGRVDIFQHLPIRTLGKENGIIAGLFTTNTFNFTKTAGAQKVKSDTVSIRFNEFVQARSQFGILSISQLALKDAILHPLTVGFQDFVDFGATIIFRDIVGYNNVHSKFLPPECQLPNQGRIFLDFAH